MVIGNGIVMIIPHWLLRCVTLMATGERISIPAPCCCSTGCISVLGLASGLAFLVIGIQGSNDHYVGALWPPFNGEQVKELDNTKTVSVLFAESSHINLLLHVSRFTTVSPRPSLWLAGMVGPQISFNLKTQLRSARPTGLRH